MMKTKNKKADLAIKLLVLLTIALCAVCLVLFSHYGKQNQKQINEPDLVYDFYSQEEEFDFYISQIILNVSKELKKSDSFLGYDEAYKAAFIILLKDKFGKGVYGYSSNEELKNQIENNAYDVEIVKDINGKDNLIFTIKNVKFSKTPSISGENQILYFSSTKNRVFKIGLN